MADPKEQPQEEKKTTVANDESKRFRGGRPINEAQMEERVTAAYNLMLQGGSLSLIHI